MGTTMSWSTVSASTSSCRMTTFPPPLSVLLVEHDRACLLILKRMLLICNYHVTSCRDANEAQSLIQSNKDSFDIALCEVHLPGTSGLELLDVVVHQTEIPVVMISSDLANGVVRRAMMCGARDYLAKPVRKHSLEHLWRHLLGKEKWRSYIARINGDAHELGKHKKAKEESIGASTFPKGVIKVKEEMDVVDDRYTQSSSFLTAHGMQIKEELVDGDDEEERRRRELTVSGKGPRISWTPELHQKFVNAVNQLGTKAVPKSIVRVMRVPGLTARHVASHLQKYRRALKKATPPVAVASSTPLAPVATDKAENSRIAAMSRPDLVQHQPHQNTMVIDLDSDGMDSCLMHQSLTSLPSIHTDSPVSFQAGMNLPFPYPNHTQATSSQCNTRIGQVRDHAGFDRGKSIPLIGLDVGAMDDFLMHQSLTSFPLVHTDAPVSFQAGMNLPFPYPNHTQATSSQCNTQIGQDRDHDGFDRGRSIPLIGLDIGAMDDFLMHQSLTSFPLVHTDAPVSFQAGMNLPFPYPNHMQATSSQCNTRIGQDRDHAGFDRGKSIPFIGLDVGARDDFLMHQSNASGSFTQPSFGSFYQDNQMNHLLASQDHLVPAQYVNGSVLTDTETILGPYVGSGGEATMSTNNDSTLYQSSHVGTSQGMATDIYDDSDQSIEDLLNMFWYD